MRTTETTPEEEGDELLRAARGEDTPQIDDLTGYIGGQTKDDRMDIWREARAIAARGAAGNLPPERLGSPVTPGNGNAVDAALNPEQMPEEEAPIDPFGHINDEATRERIRRSLISAYGQQDGSDGNLATESLFDDDEGGV